MHKAVYEVGSCHEVSETVGGYKSRKMFLSGDLVGSPVGSVCKVLPPRDLAIEWRAKLWF